MKLKIDDDKVLIIEASNVEAGEYNVTECEFEFSEHYDGLVKKAVFTNHIRNTYKVDIVDNKCAIPVEVLTDSATVTLGVYGYEIENEEFKLRYSPTPTKFWVNEGSYIANAQNTDTPTPSEFEQLEQRVTTAEGDIDLLQENVSDLAEGVSENAQDITDLTQTVADNLVEAKNYTDSEIDSLSTVAKTGSYNDLENKPFIPTKTSDLTNDSGFIDKDVNNLKNYTLKTSTGSLIDLEINGTTYVVTLRLKDIDGNVISTDTIDLPLESVVIGGSFDAVNKKIVLTLENGQTIEIPVGDLVAGLQTEITNNNKLASDLVDDTNSGNKFTNTSEKNSWNAKYDKPAGGIPKTDLSSDVQTSLGKADTAIQEHQDISGKEDKSNKVTEISSSSTDEQYPSAKCVYDSQIEQDEIITELQTELAEAQDEINDLYTEYETNTLTGESIDTTDSAQAKAKINLNGNSYQEVIEAVAGTEVSGTDITISDYDNTKESEFTKFSGDTEQATAILPSGYTQVDYIESSGTQYIDTGFKPNQNTRMTTKIYVNSLVGEYNNVGGVRNGNTNQFHIIIVSDRFDARYGTQGSNISYTTTGLFNFDFNKNQLYINNSLANTFTDITFSSNYNAYIFAVNNGGSAAQKANYKLYNMKWYDNDTLVRDFIPCYRNSDNEVGLYDLVTGVFYENQGTGDFTYGSATNIPNPDFPQSIKVVTGEQVVKKSNKNKFNYNDLAEKIQTFTITGNASDFTLEGYGSYQYPISITTEEIISGSWSSTNFNGDVKAIYEDDTNANIFSSYSGTTASGNINFIPTKKVKAIQFRTYNSNNLTIENLQIELGSTASSYIAHAEQSYPISLGNLELCKIGDYQDYLYKSNNKWYKRSYIGKVVLDGSEEWENHSGNNGLFRMPFTESIFAENGKGYCNYYNINLQYLGAMIDGQFRITQSSGVMSLFLKNTNYSTSANEWKLYLNEKYSEGNPVYVYYILATPTDTEITDTTLINQLNAIEDMEGYSGITYIDSEGDLAIIPSYKYNFITPAPSPERESEIESAGDNGTITEEIENSDGTLSQEYTIPCQQPMRSIGDVRDGFVETQSGCVERHYTGEIVLDGTEYWSFSGNTSNNISYQLILRNDLEYSSSNIFFNAKSSHYMYTEQSLYNVTDTNKNGLFTCVHSGNSLMLRIVNKDFTTVEDFKAWLAQKYTEGNPVYVDYVLSNPTDLPCTAQQIQALEQLKKAKTYQGVTHIYSDDDVPAYLELTYKKSNLLRIKALEEALQN